MPRSRLGGAGSHISGIEIQGKIQIQGKINTNTTKNTNTNTRKKEIQIQRKIQIQIQGISAPESVPRSRLGGGGSHIGDDDDDSDYYDGDKKCDGCNNYGNEEWVPRTQTIDRHGHPGLNT